MLRFAQALDSGKLLSKQMFAEATRPQIKEGFYGYGFFTVGEGPQRRFGHVGDHDGMCADFRVFPESGYVLVSLSNIDPPSANRPLNYFEPRMPIE
jgi:CubicO group peptidase (beta-lactamase class C family)